MRKTQFATVVIAATSILFGPVAAATPEKAAETEPIAEVSCSPEKMVARFEAQHQAWLEAVLCGDSKKAEQSETNLLGMVDRDILVHRESVRSLATKIALSSSDNVDPTTALPRVSQGSKFHEEFQHSVSRLETKEALYRSLRKTEAFSNKYRLLGDYIDLLRRELKMPRLKLARVGKKLPPDASGPSGSDPR